jgi:hypothetical protein
MITLEQVRSISSRQALYEALEQVEKTEGELERQLEHLLEKKSSLDRMVHKVTEVK